MQGPEKNSYKEFDNEKKFLRLENSPPHPPPHNFSNGPSLIVRQRAFIVEPICMQMWGLGNTYNLSTNAA